MLHAIAALDRTRTERSRDARIFRDAAPVLDRQFTRPRPHRERLGRVGDQRAERIEQLDAFGVSR
jgi:hypothetical protein